MRKPGSSDEAKALEDRDDKVYRLKMSLAHVHPPLWRRLEVRAGMEMGSLPPG